MKTPAIADRVSETTTTTGTGTISLSGANPRCRTFVAAVGSGRLVEYSIVHRTAGEWETGVGTVTSGSPDTLTRTTVKFSSNANAAVAFSAGTKDVFIAPPARRLMTARDHFAAASF